MSKILFLKGVSLQDSQIKANWQGDTNIELSDIYMESIRKQQIKRIEQIKQNTCEDSDLIGDIDFQLSNNIQLDQKDITIEFKEKSSNIYKGPKIKGYKLDSIKELDKVSDSIKNLVQCFYCTLVLEDPIYAIQQNQSCLKIKSVFCSFICGFSFAAGLKNTSKASQLKEMIQNYYKLKYGKLLNFKNITVCREDYCKFGGGMDHETFQRFIIEQEKKLLQ